MAITIDDFSKIWASTSPLTPYEFSEDNYKSGWNFIGSTPPSRQMWDFLQKNNDEKMQYLANNYLPLSGGTLTGALSLQNKYASINNPYENNEGNITINGGAGGGGSGARIGVNGANYGNSTTKGIFQFVADDGINQTIMQGKPDGTLTWGGNDITPQKATSETSEDVTLSNNTMKTLQSFSLTKGTWLVIGRGYFVSNSTGFRELGFSSSDNGGIMSADAHSVVQAPNGSSCFAQVMYIFSVASTTTYYLVGKQTSGGNLTASGGIVKFRLSSVN